MPILSKASIVRGRRHRSAATAERTFGASTRRRQLAIEPLEHRTVLSAISALDLGQLYAQPTLSSLAAVSNPTPTGYTPSQIAQAYGFSGIAFNGGATKGDGTGQTIAIVDAYNDPNVVNDLHIFDQTFGLANPPKFTVVNQNGSSALPATDAGWSEEIALDVEWAHAMAPGANILLVEANSNSFSDLLAAVNYARNAAGVSVVSMSWGSSEFFSETQYDPYFTTPAGHNGVTFIASAGDSGAQAIWPAISPNVLSVGGTSLNVSNGSYAGESAWSGSGGGMSRYEAEPTFQRGVQTSGARSSPDVSFDANPNTGFAVYDTVAINGRTGWLQIGGTSAGAPQWASLIAIADQGRALSGQSTLAGAQSQLYGLSSSDFHDVTSGSNGNAARAGYDLVTGRGTPIASAVVRDLVANATSSTSTQSPTTPSTPAQTTTTTYQWVYWHHRWWLVAVTHPAATRSAIDSDSMNSGMQQVATAVTGGATASMPVPTSTVAAGSSPLAGASSALAMAASQSGGGSPRGAAANLADRPGDAAAEDCDSEAAAGGSTDATRYPGDDSATEGFEAPASANWQVTRSPAELTPRLPGLAVDACFGGDGWATPLAESTSKISSALAASRELDLAGIAVALVLGANRRLRSPDDEPREAPWPRALKRRFHRAE